MNFKFSKWSCILGLCVVSASSNVFGETIPQAIALAGNRLVADQTGLGSWPGTSSSYTGAIVAGLGDAYVVTGNSSYRTSAFNGAGNIILSAGGNYLGDEAWGLATASQISPVPAVNQYRTAITTFYDVTVPNGSGGTAGYTSRLVNAYTTAFGEQSQAVFYLAEHTAAAGYVGAPDLGVWRAALINTLAQVDDNDFYPVQAAGVALWALAKTGPLDGTVISNSGVWNGVTLAQLKSVVAARQITSGADAGSFYANLLNNTAGGYTEDAVYDVLGLNAADPNLYASQTLAGQTWLANNVILSGADQGLYSDLPSAPSVALDVYSGEVLQALSAVPEPSSLALLVVASACLLGRRRRV